jgi:hypothetical protein
MYRLKLSHKNRTNDLAPPPLTCSCYSTFSYLSTVLSAMAPFRFWSWQLFFSVLLRLTVSDYPYGIFKLVLQNKYFCFSKTLDNIMSLQVREMVIHPKYLFTIMYFVEIKSTPFHLFCSYHKLDYFWQYHSNNSMLIKWKAKNTTLSEQFQISISKHLWFSK